MSLEPIERAEVEGELVDLDHDGEPDVFRPGRDVAKGSGGELVEHTGQQVDQPAGRAPIELRVRRIERRPLVPEWATSAEGVREVVVFAAGHAGHVVAFHMIRLPLYGGKVLAWCPVGLARLVAAGARWVLDAEGHAMRRQVAKGSDPDTHLRVRAEGRALVRRRATMAAVLVGLVATGGVLAGLLVPLVAYLAAAGAVVALGLAGAPKDKPIASRAVVVERYVRLTSEMVERGLRSLGLAAMTAKGARIEFPAPIQRDGPGWRAEVDLPFGMTATDVIERRDRLAAGLRRPLGCVWPEPASDEHPGRLVVWVGDVPMNKAKAPEWPLLRAGKVDIFKPVPFMIDQRMRPVGIDLVFWNMLIGAMPRMGKTFALRLVVLAAALDPYVQLRLFELKGTGDLGMCEPVAHHYASGAGVDAKEATMASLRDLYQQLETRAATITRIAKENPAACPENKVTPDLSRDPRLGLGIVLAMIDECQEIYSDKEYREEAEKLTEGIIKRGPALGIILVLATQRPDAKSLPTGVSANVGIRFCLRVMGQLENDMVLGTSSYKAGIRATTFTASDKGIGYLAGVVDDPVIGRTYGVDGPAAEKVVKRARLLREQAGTLTGHAIGEAQIVVNVAEDVAAVFGDEPKLWTTTILERLTGYRPEVYTGWTPEQLAAALKPYGITSGQVWGTTAEGKGANRQGYVLDAITRATRS
ncbi:cell division protein FtsK [Amycolatopsis cynarae]|uniref:Cell division protein FtsK n=1 Tax=Amycolatopsis cynarae TaxID=2995223 RepID=A0ABY7AZI6_9PSEU|nr:cell division protein FtsK [Amycolatopsis sp. HUAS 11-8]WAL64453.1 cell division protein FtsK [Amycolatopsis sp. HUAS 11-8]